MKQLTREYPAFDLTEEQVEQFFADLGIPRIPQIKTEVRKINDALVVIISNEKQNNL